MNPDQTAPLEQSDLGPCCLQQHEQMRERMTKVVTNEKKVDRQQERAFF